jgi:acetyl esterase
VDGTTLELYVFTPAGSPPNRRVAAVLLFHGGGWSVGSPEWTFTSARRYAEQGLVAVSVQYRLSNDTVTPVDALTDACGAFQWVRAQALKLGVDPHRIAASGVSAGGQLAAAAATIGCGNSSMPSRGAPPQTAASFRPVISSPSG